MAEPALHPDTVVEAEGDEVLLYGPHTGRHVRLHRDTLARLARLPPVAARLSRLGLLASDDLHDRIVCRHRATLLLPDVPALWVPRTDVHGAGGHAYRALPLDAEELSLWRAINDRRTVGQLAERVGATASHVLRLLRPWTDRAVQALQLRATPPRPRDPALDRLLSPTRAAHERSGDQHGPHGETTLAAYHLDAITDGATHFDDRETTVAHALALPHPGLRMRPYGLALRQALGEDGPVVEVGCGTGELAAAWLSAGEVDYVRIDLSTELLATQARTAPGSAGVLADATRLPMRSASVPFLLSNEVLADLQAVPVASGHPGVKERSKRYGITPVGWANLGSWQFVEEVARVLAPGGRAVLTEFGVLEGETEEAVQLDHPEVSIQFTDLAQVAQVCGLHAEVVRLDDLLSVDRGAPQLCRTSWLALRARARALGHHLPARAYTPASLKLPFPVEGLHFDTLADEGPGPLITRFYALILRR